MYRVLQRLRAFMREGIMAGFERIDPDLSPLEEEEGNILLKQPVLESEIQRLARQERCRAVTSFQPAARRKAFEVIEVTHRLGVPLFRIINGPGQPHLELDLKNFKGHNPLKYRILVNAANNLLLSIGAGGASSKERRSMEEVLRRAKRINWNNQLRRRTMLFLANHVLKTDPRAIGIPELKAHRMASQVFGRTRRTIHGFLSQAGYDLFPWELKESPRGFWRSRENRVQAIRWLVEITGKHHSRVLTRDFFSHNLWGLLFSYYGSSPIKALRDAGFDVKFAQRRFPPAYYDLPEIAREAADFVMKKTGKQAWQLTKQDFLDADRRRAIRKFGGSPYKLLSSIGYADESHAKVMKKHGRRTEPN